jgi:Flp pilus assembly protein TadD
VRDPLNAQALNYLGYMLADRGRSLDEAVVLIERALQRDPRNPSYLDSLGWAYFRLGRLDLAERYLREAAASLVTNSVVQDHLGDVLFRLERVDEAIAAWRRALAGDGESIDRAAIEVKIKNARRGGARP